MALWIVHRKNPYFRDGAILDLFEHGFQEVETRVEKGRRVPVGNVGLAFPERIIKPFVMKLLRKGFDKPALRRKTEYGR